MNWYPNKRAGLLFGLGLQLALVLAGFWLLWKLVGAPFDSLFFSRIMLFLIALSLLAVIAYLYYGLLNLTYRVERNGIVIRWAASFDVVPMSDIGAIVPYRMVSLPIRGGAGWPGYRFGPAQVKGLGQVRLYITGTLEDALLIRTQEMLYLISPNNVEGFMANYGARRQQGPVALWAQGLRLPMLLDLSIWRDRLAWCLLVPGLLLNAGLFAYLAVRYPDLPPRMMLSFDPRGLGDRIGARWELLLWPAIGLGILFLNTWLAAWVHRRERVMALLMMCNVPLVQALAWLALVRLIG